MVAFDAAERLVPFRDAAGGYGAILFDATRMRQARPEWFSPASWEGNARPVGHGDLEALDDELIDAIFRVNWRGAFACVRALKDLLAAGDGGLVVNISSIAAVTGIGSNVAYCASKAALNAMTLSLARALAPAIRVVSVSPGWVEGEYASRMDPAILEAQRQKTPLGRLAQAEDVAEAVLAVATSLRFSTGCIIPVDGGRPLN